MSYETLAGLPTPGITYAKLMDHLREAQDCAALLAHLQKTEDGVRDTAVGNGWLAIAELFRRVQAQVTTLAQGRLQ